jgi:hypothetical protein
VSVVQEGVLRHFQVQYNHVNIESGEDDWGFAQIIAVVLILGCLVDTVLTGYDLRYRWVRLDEVTLARNIEMMPRIPSPGCSV